MSIRISTYSPTEKTASPTLAISLVSLKTISAFVSTKLLLYDLIYLRVTIFLKFHLEHK